MGTGAGGGSDRSIGEFSPGSEMRVIVAFRSLEGIAHCCKEDFGFLVELCAGGALSSFCRSSEIFVHMPQGERPLNVFAMASVIGAFLE